MVTYVEVAEAADPVQFIRDLEDAGQLGEYFPELEALKMEIPAGYHHKDNYFHSLLVLSQALEREGGTPDAVLRIAALTHDIGKPATRKFEGGGKVTFWNHEGVGATAMKKRLKGSYEDNFRTDVSHLIRLHMRAYGFSDSPWSDSAVRRLMTDAGSSKQLERLVTIFYSDLTTRNKRQKMQTMAAIARLEEAFARVKESDARAALRPALDGRELMAVTGLPQGRELGQLMKFLNRDEMVTLSRQEALAALQEAFPLYFR